MDTLAYNYGYISLYNRTLHLPSFFITATFALVYSELINASARPYTHIFFFFSLLEVSFCGSGRNDRDSRIIIITIINIVNFIIEFIPISTEDRMNIYTGYIHRKADIILSNIFE